MRRTWIIISFLLVLCLVSCDESAVVNESDENAINSIVEDITNIPDTDIGTTTSTPTPTTTSTPTPTATSTPTPTATSTPTPIPLIVEDVESLVFSLPDCTDYAVNSVWTDSEMNLVLRCSASLLPKKGLFTAQFAYPKEAKDTNSDLNVEVFVGEKSITFSPANRAMSQTADGEWNVFAATMPYEFAGEECKIVIKTHSGSGEKSIPFAITGLLFHDTETGDKGKIKLQDSALQWTCIRYMSDTAVDYEWVTLPTLVKEVIPEFGPMPSIPDVSIPETPSIPDVSIPEIPSISASESDEKYITYRLPESESGWHAAWEESESNITMLYTSEKQLSQGTVYARLYIPKLSGVNRTDAFELAIHAQDDFMNYRGDRIDVEYSGDRISSQNKSYTEKENHYEIIFAVPYDSSKVANGNELKIIFKSHSDTAYGAYEISFCDVIVADDNAGEQVIDFSKGNVRVTGAMYVGGAPISFRYTKEPAVAEFYVSNMVAKLPLGYTYQLNVHAAEAEKIRFSSSDSSIATIDAKGEIITHKQGRCTFTITNEESGESKCFTVDVDTPRIAPISYEILMLSGSSAQFEFSTEFTAKAGEYQYHSSNADVVSVAADGSAKAHKEGVTTITVNDAANEASFTFELEVYEPEDPDGVAKYLSLGHTNLVTVDIAKRSYDLIYAVYRNVFDYFNYGEYEPVVLNFTVGDYSPAYSNMVDIFLASEHMLANAKDVDCITHELIHCAQNYPNVNDYVWLMEGLTDYGRNMFGLHNEDCGWHLTEYEPGQHYTNSYTVTANFIKYITENHCADMPVLINEMFKSHEGYRDSIWKDNTGYTVDELWELYTSAG